MRPIVGLDPSLSSTGIATEDGQGSIVTKPARTLTGQLARLRIIAAEVAGRVPAGALVMIEAPAYSRANTGTHQGAGLWWWLADVLDAKGCALVQVAPTALKKIATSRGNATKPDMRMALFKRAGLDLADDNAVDAWWLMMAGRHLLGHADMVDLPGPQRAAIEELRGQLPAG